MIDLETQYLGRSVHTWRKWGQCWQHCA